MKAFISKPVILFLAIILQAFTSYSADFFVSPKGNDSNPGTREKPFVSLERAKQAAETSFRQTPNEDCTIWLDDGKYNISRPVNFNAENFENLTGNLFFKAVSGKTPIISGGIEITKWQKNSDGLWKAELPQSYKNEKPPRELFVENRRAVRARFPNEEYLRVSKVGADRRTHFFFEPGDFPIPENEKTVELVLLHDWSISRIPVKEIDRGENKLTAVDSIGAKSPAFFNLDHWEPDPRYFLENAMEFLDAEYEWFYNSEKKTIYLKLPENENPNEMKINIPVSEGLVLLTGTENQLLKNIHFEGLTFRHSAWQIPETGYCGVQACHFDPRPEYGGWAVVPAAIKGEWIQNCSFSNCKFENLGGTGIWLGTGSSNCSVSNSHFSDISGNGMMFGEGRDREVNSEKWWQSAPEQVALGNTIEHCTVTECGKQFYGAVGIWCGLTAETTIRNNTIFNLPYTGISIGWMWSPVPTPCRENVIDGNHIHHIMRTLSDGGGIYMLGLQPESKILNNHIHDVSLNVGRAESNGMFLDEGTTDVVVENNLIYSISKSPLRFHKATTNLVKNNFLFCGENVPPIRYNNTKEEDIEKVGNQIFYETDSDFREKLKQVISAWKINR
ncbi:right-handed parallel beta-helix repeat-containing protein [Mariniphaga sp.]|uniref:right-handed parallel beta-helix repeat-containing protein n=1 Tax=Mariniphaga sp. TaxID=1954475 RepID=UPI00356A2B11